MKKYWTKKCTCENFQQNEDCEHIGSVILEEVGMPVEEVHDFMGIYHIADTHIEEQPKEELLLEGALTPLGERLAEIKKKIIEKATFEPGVSSNGWYQIYKDDLDSIL